ncbi:MAG: ABC transporter permease subunit, partial [Xanthobacteraceae bacterium]
MQGLRSLLPILIFTALYAALSLSVTNSYYQLVMTLVPVWAVFGLSWNLLSGYTGLISFGHAAFFGIGAYATALGQIYFDLSPWALIPIAAMLGGVAGLLIGFPTFRLQGHYFALAMLAYPLAILYVFEWLGFQEVTLPIKRDNPIAYMQFADPRLYTLLALAMMLGTILLTRMIERSRFGMALLAIKQNEAAAEAAGINTLAWKLRAITLSGAIAGAIGGFYAVVLLVVTPQSVFGMLVSAQALTVAMFGGVGTAWGPVIGSVILIPLAETLNAEAGSRFPGIQGVIFGLAIICVILLAPEGLFWKFRDFLRKRSAPRADITPRAPNLPLVAAIPAAPNSSRPARSQDEGNVVLEVRNLSRSFGGLKAVQNVSFKLRRNEILGIIGPNGAGKTTLFNLMNGFLTPGTGEILLDGRDMSGRKPHELCKAGIGRTFQIMRPFLRMSISDNVVVGAYVRARTDAEG